MKKIDTELSLNDYFYMKIALELSKRGLGEVYPNPSVGCVIVRDKHIVGRGWTGKGGRPHAERVALEQAKNVKGAKVYVTLEPCSHYGKTSPCAKELIRSEVAEVIIATSDPDPRVSGSGIQMLKDAGIKVNFGILKAQADIIHQGFFNRIKQNQPLITIKIASSADGKIAKNKNKKSWVTGPQSRQKGHMFRAQHDAIMVGIGTALIDDPSLDCRIPGLEDRSPIRVVVDTNLQIDPMSSLCKSANKIPLWIMTAAPDLKKSSEIKNTGAQIFYFEKDSQEQLDLSKVMTLLAEQGITRLLCEGGSKLNASLIRANLVDRLIWFKSGDFVGKNGVDALYDISLDELDLYLTLSLLDEGQTGLDHWRHFGNFSG